MALDNGAPFHEVLRLGSEGNLQSYPKDLAFLTTLALRVSAYGHPHLVQVSWERHAEAMAAYGELYGQVLAHYHLRVKAPFTTAHLAESLAALASRRLWYPSCDGEASSACGDANRRGRRRDGLVPTCRWCSGNRRLHD